jgi:RNA polymerase sigma-70 factor, ECF subfamily
MEADTSHKIVACSDEAADRCVAGLLKGDPEAHAALYEQYGQVIQTFAARRLRDPELAEDVMVQTLVDAARNIRQFSPRISTFRAWLFGIARRQILHESRLRARRKSAPAAAQVSLERAAEQAAPGDLAADSAARLDAQQQVSAIEAALSPLEMDVLTLRCVDGFSLQEIAQVVGRSERAINSLLDRAKQKARNALAEGQSPKAEGEKSYGG